MKIKLSTIILFSLLPVVLMVNYSQSLELMIGFTSFIFILYFFICFINLKSYFLGMIFGFLMFSFLFGSLLFDWDNSMTLSVSEVSKYCLIIYLSLLSIIIGLNLGSKNTKDNREQLEKYQKDSTNNKIFSITNKIFWITIPFSFLYAGLRIYFAINYGYVYLYSNSEIFITGPLALVTDINNINITSFIILLATLPKFSKVKKQSILLTAYYLILAISGTRTGLFRLLILLVCYWFINKYPYNGKKPSTKSLAKIGLFSIVGIYFFALILANVVNFRTSTDHYDSSNPITEIISEEGTTWKLVIDTMELYEDLGLQKSLSFYFKPLFDTIKLNFLLEKIGFNQKQVYTSEYALNSNDYSHYYTYIKDPSLYLSGGGLGTSYLAESYLFFNYFGVVVHSLILGFLLSYFSTRIQKHIIINAYMLTFLYDVFWSPRGSALAPFFSFFSFSNVVLYGTMIIYILSINDKRRKILTDPKLVSSSIK